jgi:hypothetical protein
MLVRVTLGNLPELSVCATAWSEACGDPLKCELKALLDISPRRGNSWSVCMNR